MVLFFVPTGDSAGIKTGPPLTGAAFITFIWQKEKILYSGKKHKSCKVNGIHYLIMVRYVLLLMAKQSILQVKLKQESRLRNKILKITVGFLLLTFQVQDWILYIRFVIIIRIMKLASQV